jgi:hypothetical protein
MNKNIILTLAFLMLLSFTLIACGSIESKIPENASLVIVGNVDQEVGWMEETVKTMDVIEVESTNSKGESDTYTGVSIKSLLEEAGVKPDAMTVIFFSDDGNSSSEIPVRDVLSCDDCIVSFRNKGGFSIVAPDLSKDAQIKGVVRIEVK